MVLGLLFLGIGGWLLMSGQRVAAEGHLVAAFVMVLIALVFASSALVVTAIQYSEVR